MEGPITPLVDAVPEPVARRAGRAVWLLLIVGTILRLVVIAHSSPERTFPFLNTYGWPADHATYVIWARHMTSTVGGLVGIYTTPPDQRIKVRLSFGETFVHHGQGELVNYPPLGVYLIYLQGLLHRILDPELIANTAIARAVFDLFALVGDLLLAWGVWRTAGTAFGDREATVAFGVIYLIPPVWLDSCWWGQTDSWVLAPAVWIVWSLMRRRWLLAGALWGVGLALKPQAVLLAPVWAFVWLASLTPAWRREFGGSSSPLKKGTGGLLGHVRDPGERARLGASSLFPRASRWRDSVGIATGVVVAVAVVNFIALPFWLTSGDAWLQQSYLRNLLDEAPHTTLRAFNIWYVDLLLTLDTDVGRTLVGLTRDRWGQVLSVAGLLVAAGMAWRCRYAIPHRILLFAGGMLLVAVMLPTRVHERYILMCLPFLVTAAAGWRRLWSGVAGLIVVACLQLTVYHWLPLGADAWSRRLKEDTISHHSKALAKTPPELLDQLPTQDEAVHMRFEFFREEQRRTAPMEWAVTILALLSASYIFVLSAARSGPYARDARWRLGF